jgi:hypothetical protein
MDTHRMALRIFAAAFVALDHRIDHGRHLFNRQDNDIIRKKIAVFLMLVAWTHSFGLAKDASEDIHENNQLSYGAETDIVSKVLWYGFEMDGGAGFEPSAWVSLSDFTFSAWCNYALQALKYPSSNGNRCNLVEILLDYKKEFGPIAVEPMIGYYYLSGERGTAELTFKASYRIIGPFSVFTGHAFDIISYLGAYYGEAGVSFQKKLPLHLGISSECGLGWASAEFNKANLDSSVNKWALNLFRAQADLVWSPLSFFYIKPHAEFSWIIDNGLRDELKSNGLDPINLGAGLLMGVEF